MNKNMRKNRGVGNNKNKNGETIDFAVNQCVYGYSW